MLFVSVCSPVVPSAGTVISQILTTSTIKSRAPLLLMEVYSSLILEKNREECYQFNMLINEEHNLQALIFVHTIPHIGLYAPPKSVHK